MSAVAQKILNTFINPHLKLFFLSFLCAGCTQLGFVDKSASLFNIDVEQSYFPNGNLEYEAKYVNGKLEGTSRVWLEDGTLLSESEYSNGQPHGIWKRYHPNGFVMYEVQYEYGKKYGDEKWFHDNNQIKSQQKFNDGKPESEIIRWQSDGTLVY